MFNLDSTEVLTLGRYEAEVSESFGPHHSDRLSFLSCLALGLIGESGEVVDLHKKISFLNQPFLAAKMAEELGDVLWYVVATFRKLEFPVGASLEALTMSEFQEKIHVEGADSTYLSCLCLGLASKAYETGSSLHELAEHGSLDSVGILIRRLQAMLGYVVSIALRYGLSLDQIARENLRKLQTRYPNGFTARDSVNRADESSRSAR